MPLSTPKAQSAPPQPTVASLHQLVADPVIQTLKLQRIDFTIASRNKEINLSESRLQLNTRLELDILLPFLAKRYAIFLKIDKVHILAAKAAESATTSSKHSLP